MNSIKMSLKKAAAILEEALNAANNIISLREQLEALSQQKDALDLKSVYEYFRVPEFVVDRVLISIEKKKSILNEQMIEQVKVMESVARKMGFILDHSVEAALLANPTEVLQLTDQVMIRKCTLLEWLMYLKDGLLRESVAIKSNHEHNLFSKYLNDRHLISLVLDTAALLK